MVIHGIAATLLTLSMLTSANPDIVNNNLAAIPEYKNIGEYRITTYCKFCNEPEGRQTASGIPLEPGHVATKDLPLGSKISIEGDEFTVTDVCGIDNTIDIYVENDSGYCQCDTLEYEDVMLKTEQHSRP